MKKSKLFIMIGSSVIALIILGVGVLLFLGIRDFTEKEKRLQKVRKELNSFYQRKPFPSQENVQKEHANITVMQEWFDTLMAELQQGQIEPQERTPATFMSLLGQRKSILLQRGQRVFRDNFSFGFDRYYQEGAALPAPSDVPRLTQQLVIIQHLAMILIEEQIPEVMGIWRDEFESAGLAQSEGDGAFGGRGGARAVRRATVPTAGSTAVPLIKPYPAAGLLQDDALFATLRFAVRFRGKEAQMLQVVNRLAQHEMFARIVSLTVTKDSAEVRRVDSDSPAVQAARGESALGRDHFPSVAQRMVSGPEMETPMQVTLLFDVYRFRRD